MKLSARWKISLDLVPYYFTYKDGTRTAADFTAFDLKIKTRFKQRQDK